MQKLYHFRERPKMFTFNSWEKMNFGGGEDETSTETTTPQFYAAPEHPEAKAARGLWGQKINTDWNEGNMYGMIQPNWDDIYSSAAKKVNQHYWGSPLTGGGAMGAVKSDLARRGMQDSPTASIMRGRLGSEEANELGQLQSDVGYKKALAGETSRINWLQSMQNLAGLPVQGQWGGTNTTTMTQPGENPWGSAMQGVGSAIGYGVGNMMLPGFGGAIGGGIGGMAGNWMRDLTSGKPTAMPQEISGGVRGIGNEYDWMR